MQLSWFYGDQVKNLCFPEAGNTEIVEEHEEEK